MRASNVRLGEAGNGLLALMTLAAVITGLALGAATDGTPVEAPSAIQEDGADDVVRPAAGDSIEDPAQETSDDTTGGGAADTPVAPEDAPLPASMIKGLREVLDGVYNDIFYFGNAATLTGKLLDNGFFFAQTVTVRDTVVEGDLLVFAQQTTIDAEIMGDVYSFNMALDITENAVIHGNVHTFAGMLTHEGTIHGTLHGGGGETYLNGSVGSVDLECGSIEVGPAARIAGDFAYEAKEEAEVSPEAAVGGEIRWNRPDPEADGEEEDGGGGISAWSVGIWIWKFLAAFLVGAVILAVGGRAAREPTARLLEQPAQGLGFGFVVAVVVPVACIAAMVTIVGIPLGVIGTLLYLIALFVARLITSQAVGTWLLGRLRSGGAVNEYAALAVGLLVYRVLVSIPYVGFLVWLAAIIAGFGGVFLTVRRTGKVTPVMPEPPPITAPAGA